MITGAAAGIIGVLSGQGMMAYLKKKSEPWHVGVPLTEAEVKEIVVKDPAYISKSTVEEAMAGLANQMQQALNQQAEGVVSLMQQASAENAKAVRIAEARAQVAAPSNGAADAAVMQQMASQLETLKAQLGV